MVGDCLYLLYFLLYNIGFSNVDVFNVESTTPRGPEKYCGVGS